MRDPNRIYPFTNKLIELWALVPDFRFYQLIDFIGNRKDHFYTEDEQSLKRIQEIIDEIKTRS